MTPKKYKLRGDAKKSTVDEKTLPRVQIVSWSILESPRKQFTWKWSLTHPVLAVFKTRKAWGQLLSWDLARVAPQLVANRTGNDTLIYSGGKTNNHMQIIISHKTHSTLAICLLWLPKYPIFIVPKRALIILLLSTIYTKCISK